MAPVLHVRNLHKSFGGVPVLRGVSFEAAAGELVGLAGENGAGKSTLMKIVTGQVRQDAGEVTIAGTVLGRADPLRAKALGVAIVPQELAPYPDLTVYENLFVGRELRNRAGLLARVRMAAQAKDMLDVFGLDIDPKARMNRLSVALVQLVEIVKATTLGAKLILLDEPTSSIPEREVGRLYEVVHRLKEQGVAMVCTTHRMEEMSELADQIVVLRDGQLVLDTPIGATSEEEVVQAMIGRQLGTLFPERTKPTDHEILEVQGLQLLRGGPTVDLSVKGGEIVGLGGLVGAGRTEILEAIFGFRRSRGGAVSVDGRAILLNNPAAAIRAGIALVPEDRKGAGLVLLRSVLDNGSLPHLGVFSRFGWIQGRKRRNAVGEAVKSVSLRSRGLRQSVGTLSGGNQQKVVLARWLTQDAKVLLLDEPTRGVDVGARGEIYAIIQRLARQGVAVLLASSDMPELIGLSNRVLVLRKGHIVASLDQSQLGDPGVQEQIFRAASGQESSSVQRATAKAPENQTTAARRES